MNQKSINQAIFWSNLPLMAGTVLMPVYCVELGFSPLKTTGLTAVFSLCLLLTKIVAGGLCDKVGRVAVFRGGVLLSAFSYFALAFSVDALPLYLSQILKGIAFSLLNVSAYVMLTEDTAQSPAISLGKMSASEGRGGILGVLLTVPLFWGVSYGEGWKRFFLGCGATALFALIYYTRDLVETRSQTQKNNSVFESHWHSHLTKSVKGLALLNGLYCLSISTISAIIVLYLNTRFGGDLSMIVLALFLPAVAVTYLKPRIGKIASGKNPMQVFRMALVGNAAFIAMIPFAGTPQQFAVLWTGYEITIAFCGLSLGAGFATVANDETRGMLSGFYNGGADLGRALGAFAGGAVLGYGGYVSSWFLAIGCTLLTIAVACAMTFWLRGDACYDLRGKKADI